MFMFSITCTWCHWGKDPIKKHSGEHWSLFLSHPALDQEAEILLFLFINQTCSSLSLNWYLFISSQSLAPYSPSRYSLGLSPVLISAFSEFLPGLLAWLYPTCVPWYIHPITQTAPYFLSQSLEPQGYLCLPLSPFTSHLANISQFNIMFSERFPLTIQHKEVFLLLPPRASLVFPSEYTWAHWAVNFVFSSFTRVLLGKFEASWGQVLSQWQTVLKPCRVPSA